MGRDTIKIMGKHTVKWGEDSPDKSLSRKEKKELLKRVDNFAKDTRVFRIEVRPVEANFLKGKLANVYIIQATEEKDGKVWLVIGVDGETTQAEYSRI